MTSNADVVAASTRSPAISRTVADLRRRVGAWRKDGHSVALVPTMGAIHDGHIALVRAAASRATRIVASLFVNPTQFVAGEDFDSYPGDEATDTRLLAAAGVELLFAPAAEEMYAPGFTTAVHVSGLAPTPNMSPDTATTA